MDLPIELFLSFIAFAVVMGIIGLWKRIPIMMFIAGAVITFWAITTDNIIMGFVSTGAVPTAVPYQVITNTGNGNLFTPTSPIRGEYPTSSSSMLLGDRFDCMSVPLAKTGSPSVAIPVKAGVFDATGTLVRQFGQDLNVTNITSGFFFYDFCLPEGEYYTVGSLPAFVERIGVEYRGGNSTNLIATRIDANNPYDSTITVLSTFNSGTGAWTQTSASDFDMILSLRGVDNSIENVPFEFTEYPKILFGLIASIFMLSGALVWKYEEN